MGRSGTNKRQLGNSVQVRLDDLRYEKLTRLAEEEGTGRAEYIRRRVFDRSFNPDLPDTGARLSEADRAMLAHCIRNLGFVAGIMKRAVFELPSRQRYDAIAAVLDTHHDELQDIQSELRKLVERLQ